MDVILHITEREAWEAAQREGVYRSASLATEGFVHCSTPAQVIHTAERFYRGRRGLVLLVIAPERLGHELRYEAADGERFPHLYGPLNLDAVVRALPFEPDAQGRFALPEGLTDAD